LSECCTDGTRVSLIPSPPGFFRDFAESLLESAFIGQAISGSYVLFARTRFEIQEKLLNWTFLLIPDPPSLEKLTEILNTSVSTTRSPHD
jgi:hypothetical protein